MFVKPTKSIEFALPDGSGPPIALCSKKAGIKSKFPWFTLTCETQVNEIRTFVHTFPRLKQKEIFRIETLRFLRMLPKFEKQLLNKETEEPKFHEAFTMVCVLRETLFGKVLPLCEDVFVSSRRYVETMPKNPLRKI